MNVQRIFKFCCRQIWKLFRRPGKWVFGALTSYALLTAVILAFCLLIYHSDKVPQNVFTFQGRDLFHLIPKMRKTTTLERSSCKDLTLLRIPDPTIDTLNKSLFCDDAAENRDVVCRWFFNQIGLEEGRSCDRPDDGYGVPKIVYYVIFGPYNFQFWHYVSIMSAKKIIKPWGLYVIGDAHPFGYWWKRAMKDVKGLRFVYREQPPKIANRTVQWKHHLSDLVRLQMLMLNGGIYLDTDMVVVNSLDPIRNHDITMGIIENGNMGNAIILAKRHSPFVKEWYEGYFTFNGSDYFINSLHVPFDMWQKNPGRIHLESDKFYRPNWFEADKLYNKSDFPWQNKYAVHIWTSSNPVPKGPEELKTLNTTIGQIFRYILYDDPALPKIP